MDKSRFKRPPDVDEALSSMLWTPYDQPTHISSSSTDSLSDDEREREKRKLNRHSNPLPSSLNWWNSPVTTINPALLRYSFPFYGNYLPPQPHPDHTTATDTGGGQTTPLNTSSYALSSPPMAHSFTDDFYHYQVIKIPISLHICESRGSLLLFTLAFYVRLIRLFHFRSHCRCR
jgi:hypothetical protein